MNYIIPYIDQNYTQAYIVPVAGPQTGVYLLQDTDQLMMVEAMYASPICAGTIDIDLSTLTTTLSL